MDTFTVVSIVTFVGFVALAAALLGPIYLFLNREEKATDVMTAEQLADVESTEARIEQGSEAEKEISTLPGV